MDPTWTLYEEDALDSKMEVVKDHLSQRPDNPYVAVRADVQRAGRGRRGRTWVSAPDNLYLSFSLPMGNPSQRDFEYAIWIGLALYQTLKKIDDSLPFILKWPNDILLDGKKIGGLLLEVYEKGVNRFMVTGVGLNLNSKPDLERHLFPVGCIRDHISYKLSPNLFMKDLLEEVWSVHCFWLEKGFESIRLAWKEASFQSGTYLEVVTSQGVLKGTFLDLDPQGRLLLKDDLGRVHVCTTGDVALIGRMDNI